MGDLNVRIAKNSKDLNDFTRSLLSDIHALETMLEEDWFNTSPKYIGAEQEMCLVDRHYKPSPKAMEVLSKLEGKNFTTELAKFNMELNLDPLILKGGCFDQLEKNLREELEHARNIAETHSSEIILTGILPTFRKFDLTIENLTPYERYYALMEAIGKMRGKSHEFKISSVDELNFKHDSALLEACNTSFQVHLQVSPSDFVKKYNAAQVLAAPVLSMAANSPLLLGKRLWCETRIALFEQSVDTRVASDHLRERSGRVMFGNGWIEDSMIELYKEDITRFRVLLMCDNDENALQQIEKGIPPKLRSLNIFNSTVYRWNRACYGISANGKPHLRIENRVLPSGPSVIDEVANTAFWIGLMEGFGEAYEDVKDSFEFDHIKTNFLSAARNGINANFYWANGRKESVSQIVKEELLPIAKIGLEKQGIPKEEIDKHLDVIKERNERKQTGSQWVLNSFTQLQKKTSREHILMAITSSMIANQKTQKPVHEWDLATEDHMTDWHPYSMLVEEFMTTDLFTVHADDIPELVADMISWRKIKYLPVEDMKGKLKGLITFRELVNYFAKENRKLSERSAKVKDLMIKNPITIEPERSITEALKIMLENKVDCLPVVKNQKLIGIITEGNFLNITNTILKT